MDADDAMQQATVAALNISVAKFTQYNGVSHNFLMERWQQILDVRHLTLSEIASGGPNPANAYHVATLAVREGRLHESLLQHAVLYATSASHEHDI